MEEMVATCPETSQAMQRYDEDPHLHLPRGGIPPNLLDSVELLGQDTMKMDEHTLNKYTEVNMLWLNGSELLNFSNSLGISMLNR